MQENFLSDFSWVSNPIFHVISKILIILFAVFLIDLLVRKLYYRFERGVKRKKNGIYHIAISSLKTSIRIFIWVFSISYIILVMDRWLDFNIIDSTLLARKIIFIILIGLFIIKFINGYELYIKTQNKVIKSTSIRIDILCKITKVVVIVFVSITIIGTLGIDISGLLTLSSISGLVIGFASKDLLANFFGAVLIHLDTPFQVGDRVSSPDKNIEGTVESISWRLTKIRAFDKRPLYVPNSVFNSIVIENSSRMSHRRIREIIGVRYSDIKSIKQIVNDVRDMLMNDEEIDSAQAIIVNLIQFNQFSVDFMVSAFTRTTDLVKYQQVKQNVLLKISEIVANNSAEIAFPTRVVYLKNDITKQR